MVVTGVMIQLRAPRPNEGLAGQEGSCLGRPSWLSNKEFKGRKIETAFKFLTSIMLIAS